MSIDSVTETVPVGYKQTELGVIPEDWEVVCLGNIGTVRMCKRVFSWQTKKTGDIPFFKIGTFGGVPDAYIVESLYQQFKNKYSFPEVGDILFSAAGTLGKTVVYDGRPAYFQDSNIVWMEVDRKQLINEYLYYYYKVINWGSSEGSTIARLYNGIILASKIALPPKKEQTAIANALSDVDELINELENLITKKQAIKTATMQQLLTGRTRLPQFALREDGMKKGTKPSELGDIPEDWEWTLLEEIARFLKGSGLPKSQLNEHGKYECIHYGQLFTQLGPKVDLVLSWTDFDGDVRSISNDILMPTSDVTPTGLATASCINKDDVVLGGDILIIRAESNKLNGVFFAYLILVMHEEVMRLVTGSTVYHLYGSDMAKFSFAMPSFEEQTAIATILSDMDEEIQALELRLNKTRQIKQGMMQELLTGKTRLIKPSKEVVYE